MSDYIERDIWKSLPDDLPYKASVKRVLIQAPAADVRPVVRGKWIFDDPLRADFMCSACLERQIVCSNYCPYCGAYMEQEDEG